MRFEKILQGINRFLDSELYTGLNNWQEMIARITVARVLSNQEIIKQTILSNPSLQTFAVVSADGEIDAETLLKEIKEYIAGKGKMTITVPLMGSFTFLPEDVDKLYRYIMEG